MQFMLSWMTNDLVVIATLLVAIKKWNILNLLWQNLYGIAWNFIVK